MAAKVDISNKTTRQQDNNNLPAWQAEDLTWLELTGCNSGTRLLWHFLSKNMLQTT
jgi:hypothetical protein